MFGQGKAAKPRKVECSVCEMTFDSDYRKRHNEKYHNEILAAHCHIPYKFAGAPESPFTLAKKAKLDVSQAEVPNNASTSSTSSPASYPGAFNPIYIDRPVTA